MKAASSLQLRKVAAATGLSASLFLVVPMAHAEFALNFDSAVSQGYVIEPHFVTIDCRDPTTLGRCVRGGTSSGIRDPDPTPFLQELFADVNGEYYYHVVVGTEADGFAQEFFIKAHGTGWYTGAMVNASGGSIYNGGTDVFAGEYAVDPLSPTKKGNWYEMSHSGGSGSGNPTRMIFRQLIIDPEMTQEVVKSTFLHKPRITQSVSDMDMTSTFEVDMSNLTYNDMTTGATVVNQMTITAPGIPYDYADKITFDMALDSQDSNANAGFYTYTPGQAFKGAFGDYNYAESSWDFYGMDWSTFSREYNIPNTK